jgi:hypothetical protein
MPKKPVSPERELRVAAVALIASLIVDAWAFLYIPSYFKDGLVATGAIAAVVGTLLWKRHA